MTLHFFSGRHIYKRIWTLSVKALILLYLSSVTERWQTSTPYYGHHYFISIFDWQRNYSIAITSKISPMASQLIGSIFKHFIFFFDISSVVKSVCLCCGLSSPGNVADKVTDVSLLLKGDQACSIELKVEWPDGYEMQLSLVKLVSLQSLPQKKMCL